jgi:hypothetical protein
MLRVVDVQDGHTIVVERDGKREPIALAGVEIVDEARARDLLYWMLESHWIMLESAPDGGTLVYRSPDALFMNRELVIRGYARATLREVSPEPRIVFTYLGQLDPPAMPARRVSEPESRSGTGTGRRSPGSPSRPAKRRDSSARPHPPRGGSSGRSSGS